MVYGAALSHGIPANRRTFAANIEAPIPAPEPAAAQPTPEAEPVIVTALSARELRELKELHAMADAKADEFLAALGLD